MLERFMGLTASQGGQRGCREGAAAILAVVLVAGGAPARADDAISLPPYAWKTQDALAAAPWIRLLGAPAFEVDVQVSRLKGVDEARKPGLPELRLRHRRYLPSRNVWKAVPTGYGTAKAITGFAAGSVALAKPHHFEELNCLALNVYFEARGEDRKGQRAVAHVVMNRVKDRRFPKTICDVVRQGGEAVLHRCQFSWWCDGQSDRPKNLALWKATKAVAQSVYWGASVDPTEGALWYHADYVMPHWGRVFKQGPKIGRHIFYVADEKGLYLAANHSRP